MANFLSRRQKPSLGEEEVKILSRKFVKLDLDKSGTLSIKEFQALPGLKTNPLAKRILDIFDLDKNGELDFDEFLTGISTFGTRGQPEKKLKFAFRVFDKDKDGYITNCELFDITKLMIGNNLDDVRIQQIVDKTIMYNDMDGDGRINFDEFCRALGPLLLEDIENKMNIFNS